MGHQNWFIKGIKAAFELVKIQSTGQGEEKREERSRLQERTEDKAEQEESEKGRERRTTDHGQRTTEDDD